MEQFGTIAAGHQRVLWSVIAVAVIVILYRFATRAVARYFDVHSYKEDNKRNFLLLWRYAWMGAVLILVLVLFSGSLTTIGISAAFLGLIFGWSLQSPVTGIAAWFMLILKRPFKIGDRIIVAGITGDVVDINLTHIQLDQVGGTIGGEERSGRMVLVPNAILFQQVIYNYTFNSRYILDEVAVLVTFDSDYAEAERMLLDAARDITNEIIERTGCQPFVRAEIADSGIRLRVRYQAYATDRQRITSDITRRIIEKLRTTPSVRFAYPHTQIVYDPEGQKKREK